MDDFYTKWTDDDEEDNSNSKSSNDLKQRTDSKWEIINFFVNKYLIDQKEIDRIVKKISWPITINENADKLYDIFFSNDTGPSDIADFLIGLGHILKVNVGEIATEKIKNFRKNTHSLKEWAKFFKVTFPKILSDYPYYRNLFKIVFTLAYRKCFPFVFFWICQPMQMPFLSIGHWRRRRRSPPCCQTLLELAPYIVNKYIKI
jgi:hypothetical protein